MCLSCVPTCNRDMVSWVVIPGYELNLMIWTEDTIIFRLLIPRFAYHKKRCTTALPEVCAFFGASCFPFGLTVDLFLIYTFFLFYFFCYEPLLPSYFFFFFSVNDSFFNSEPSLLAWAEPIWDYFQDVGNLTLWTGPYNSMREKGDKMNCITSADLNFNHGLPLFFFFFTLPNAKLSLAVNLFLFFSFPVLIAFLPLSSGCVELQPIRP